ncbi:MAG: 30S ribosomal protein S14 [Synechococcaceae cyanobacterium RM1_1_27]|nr:30S ribosomal protein S14 [Synechococcaceae cyanobacterium SM2_3_2]NJO85363.1 30S ribosomal protein S14 [Synechococcaceae cyanobacterium RM1_1_27]
MAKKSMIEREKKRQKLVDKYREQRSELKVALANLDLEPDERMELHAKLQKLPRASSRTRLRNRCWVTGRPHGVFSDFGLSRNTMREMAHQGLLPGVVKSSW